METLKTEEVEEQELHVQETIFQKQNEELM